MRPTHSLILSLCALIWSWTPPPFIQASGPPGAAPDEPCLMLTASENPQAIPSPDTSVPDPPRPRTGSHLSDPMIKVKLAHFFVPESTPGLSMVIYFVLCARCLSMHAFANVCIRCAFPKQTRLHPFESSHQRAPRHPPRSAPYPHIRGVSTGTSAEPLVGGGCPPEEHPAASTGALPVPSPHRKPTGSCPMGVWRGGGGRGFLPRKSFNGVLFLWIPKRVIKL